MIKTLARLYACKAGFIDKSRVPRINDYLLYDNMPNLKSGALYVEGSGTASAYVAIQAAKIWLKGEFNLVAFTGGRIPSQDPTLKYVSDRLIEDGLPLPEEVKSETILMMDYFFSHLEENAVDKSTLDRSVFMGLEDGMNTGAKVRSFKKYWDKASPVQAVSLSYEQRRVLGTLRKELGPDAVISVDGVNPMGFNRNNWHLDPIAYTKVMDEADKTGPRRFGKPLYSKFFDEVDVPQEIQRVLSLG